MAVRDELEECSHGRTEAVLGGCSYTFEGKRKNEAEELCYPVSLRKIKI